MLGSFQSYRFGISASVLREFYSSASSGRSRFPISLLLWLFVRPVLQGQCGFRWSVVCC
ncbi:hypothetical protein [Anaplasma phagocytophilum]|uniref:hypothetical protein n=1 Tax=Anaplasma phagocytophilum TaxID=948 RepID=UPI00061F8A26|nr:hypothetical protein [Anaplasma phagocytophilum]KJV82380.1 hypothetical protein APHHGE2_0608 [Anaplasma phagocytophilum str. HGE2]KJV99217.1 hypothetical protein OTSANNIE_0582 [Anaplasma phagocytophilum str. Annie]